MKLPKLSHRRPCLDLLGSSCLGECLGTWNVYLKFSHSETVIVERAHVSILVNSVR